MIPKNCYRFIRSTWNCDLFSLKVINFNSYKYIIIALVLYTSNFFLACFIKMGHLVTDSLLLPYCIFWGYVEVNGTSTLCSPFATLRISVRHEKRNARNTTHIIISGGVSPSDESLPSNDSSKASCRLACDLIKCAFTKRKWKGAYLLSNYSRRSVSEVCWVSKQNKTTISL